MSWKFWPRQRKDTPEPTPAPQRQNFGRALHSVSYWVAQGHEAHTVWRDLPRWGVTEAELLDGLRAGKGREVLSLARWQQLAAAGLGDLSAVAGAIVGELGGEVEEVARVELGEQDPTPQPSQSSSSGSSYQPDLSNIEPEAKELWSRGVERYEAGDLMGAIDLWSQAIDLDPNYAYAYNSRGSLYCDCLKDYQKAVNDFTEAIRIQKDESIFWANRGNAYSGLKQYEEALSDYTEAIRLNPNYASAYNGRGNVYNNLKYYQDALADCTEALHIHPNFNLAYNNRGNAYSGLKQYQEALSDYNRAIELDPRFPLAYNNRGIAYYALKQYQDAIRDYTEAIRLDPNYANAYNGRGNAYKNLKQYQDAIRDYDRAIELDSEYDSAYNGRGNAYYDLKQYQDAIRDYDRAIELYPNYAYAYNGRGNAYYDLKQYQDALADYNRAIELDSECASAYTGRGNVSYDLKQYQDAIRDYDRAIELYPNYAYAYNGRGNAYKNLKQYQDAIRDYNRAIELYPNYAIAYTNRGNTYKEIKRYQDAIANYNEAIRHDPSYVSAYNGRGNAYYDLKQHQDAIRDYTEAICLDPNYVYAYNNRGITYKDLKQYQNALADYSQAIRLDLNYAMAYNNRGVAYKDIKQYQDAIRDYDKAIELDPKSYRPWWNRGLALYDTSGYQAALENWDLALREHIHPDIEPLGCAILHYQKGLAHSYQAKRNFSRSLNFWAKATNCYNAAYNLIETNPLYTTDTLKILRNWIVALRAAGATEDANLATLNAIQRLDNALKIATPEYRKILRVEFDDFYYLNVDRLLSENQPWKALAAAEAWKTLALDWLSEPNAEPQTLTPASLQAKIDRAPADTAFLYWHLSPAQITTFLLRPHQEPHVFAVPSDPPYDTAPKTQTNFTEWLKRYKKLYEANRKKEEIEPIFSREGRRSFAPTDSPTNGQEFPDNITWTEALPQLLAHLAQILQIDDILPHLKGVDSLVLIPHRDLHLLPLHALFQSPSPTPSFPVPTLARGVRGDRSDSNSKHKIAISYRPNLTFSTATPPTTPEPALLAIQNPKSSIATGSLPWAETEVDCLATFYASTPINRDKATLETISREIVQPRAFFHFAGHGSSDASHPRQSCLYLNGEEVLSVGDLLELKLSPYELVSLAACETALSGTSEFIDEYVGLPSAFLKSGVQQVLSSQWEVESFATLLTMLEFHRRYRQGIPAQRALLEVQAWLRNLTKERLIQWLLQAQNLWRNEPLWGDKLIEVRAWPPGHQPYCNPVYWAAFVLTTR
ncbi:tetratricopeptide repeat protein [Oscillatoria sp. FACHB-1406]|uniref:CHAT domain-containing protein n=1 Tax=Oscillatoria sp. FACHB-1406 TaxID=2692846 RepID=UPI00168821EA|nr:tetratricopeptide repeat protein [Oscillatoria sp. FACHB-1406]MBD2576736.1 tetratricopeptide repeat protein [Oscillatoria sp. FACHB-1406]